MRVTFAAVTLHVRLTSASHHSASASPSLHSCITAHHLLAQPPLLVQPPHPSLSRHLQEAMVSISSVLHDTVPTRPKTPRNLSPSQDRLRRHVHQHIIALIIKALRYDLLNHECSQQHPRTWPCRIPHTKRKCSMTRRWVRVVSHVVPGPRFLLSIVLVPPPFLYLLLPPLALHS